MHDCKCTKYDADIYAHRLLFPWIFSRLLCDLHSKCCQGRCWASFLWCLQGFDPGGAEVEPSTDVRGDSVFTFQTAGVEMQICRTGHETERHKFLPMSGSCIFFVWSCMSWRLLVCEQLLATQIEADKLDPHSKGDVTKLNCAYNFLSERKTFFSHFIRGNHMVLGLVQNPNTQKLKTTTLERAIRAQRRTKLSQIYTAYDTKIQTGTCKMIKHDHTQELGLNIWLKAQTPTQFK